MVKVTGARLARRRPRRMCVRSERGGDMAPVWLLARVDSLRFALLNNTQQVNARLEATARAQHKPAARAPDPAPVSLPQSSDKHASSHTHAAGYWTAAGATTATQNQCPGLLTVCVLILNIVVFCRMQLVFTAREAALQLRAQAFVWLDTTAPQARPQTEQSSAILANTEALAKAPQPAQARQHAFSRFMQRLNLRRRPLRSGILRSPRRHKWLFE